jgi:hypothetical protein
MPHKDKRVVKDDRRDEQLKRRFGVDQTGEVAQDLPGAEHGNNVVDNAREMRRNLPQQHGGEIGGDGGLRGDRNIGDAARRGHRKRN